MKENRQHIDDIFKQQLGDYTEIPDAAVWTKLEQRLDEKPGRKRMAVWFWMLLLCFTAAGISIPVSYYGQKGAGKTAFAREGYAQTEKIQTPQTQITNNTQTTTNTTTSDHTISVKGKSDKINTQTTTIISTDHTNNTTTPAVSTTAATPAISSSIPSETAGTIPVTERRRERIFALSPRGHQLLATALQTALNLPQIILQTIGYEASYQIQKLQTGRSKLLTVAPTMQHYYAYTSAAYFAKGENTVSITETTGQDTNSETIPAPESSLAPTDSNSNMLKNRFVFGIKGGYEFGTQQNALNKFVISPYVQYMLSPRFSLMTQPAVKYGNVRPTELSKGSYYNIIDTAINPDMATNGPNTMVRTLYYQTEYDSLIITNRIKGSNQWQIDIPLMLNYKLKKNLDVYGGVNINISKPVQIEMDQQAYRIVRYDTIELSARVTTASSFSTYPDTPPVDEVVTHGDAQPYSSYNSAIYQNPTQNPLKYGITLGFSYNFRQRLLFDFLYTQNLSGMSYIPNETVRKMYSQPYFRFTLGFRLSK